MNDNQFEKLTELLTKRAPIGDMFMKIGVSVCVAGILFVGAQGKYMNDQLIILNERYAAVSETTRNLSAFAQQPRFTQDMFDRQLVPILQRIDRNDRRIDVLERGEKR